MEPSVRSLSRPTGPIPSPTSRVSQPYSLAAQPPRSHSGDIIVAAWGDASRFLPQPGFQVLAERGAAWLEMPEKILWSNSSGSKEERLALEPTVGDILNDQFHRLVRGDHSLAPTIRDALEIARLVSILRQSSQQKDKHAGLTA